MAPDIIWTDASGVAPLVCCSKINQESSGTLKANTMDSGMNQSSLLMNTVAMLACQVNAQGVKLMPGSSVNTLIYFIKQLELKEGRKTDYCQHKRLEQKRGCG